MKKIISYLLAIPSVISFSCSIAYAQAGHKPGAASSYVIPLDAAVRTGKLPNGFTYYIRHNEEPKNRVIFYLVNKVGSILEDEDQRGLAHFMEHMSFNGTRHFPKGELVNYLQKSGVRFGADINAYTNYDETVYELPLPTDDPSIVANGLQIVRDWAHEATLDPVEINKERGVVLEEKRLGKGAGERMQRQYFPIMSENSRYSVRSPIGIDQVLNNFKPATIKRFYDDWYRPDLQAVIIVGDVDVNDMEKKVKEKFSDLKNPVNERKRIQYTIPLTGKNHFVKVTDKEMTATEFEMIIKRKAKPFKTAADYRNMLVQLLFNNMLSERYAQLGRKSDQPFIGVDAEAGHFMGDLDDFSISVAAKPGQLEPSIKTAWKEIVSVRKYGFTDEELNRAKNEFMSGLGSALQEADKTNSASYVQEYLQYFLNSIPSPGIKKEFAMAKEFMPAITLKDIDAFTKLALSDVNRDILVLAPEAEKQQLPDEKLVLSWLASAENDQINKYTETGTKAPFLMAQPTGGKIMEEKTDSQTGITTLLLDNGVRILLKPTTFKNNEILFTAFAPGGYDNYSDEDYQSATAANMIPSFGAGNYDQFDLEKFLSDKQLSVKPYIAERFKGVNGGAANKDIENALQLLYAYYTKPRKDTVLFENAISRLSASLTDRLNSPNAVYQDTLAAILGNHNPRKTGPSEEKIKQINLEKAFSIYKTAFSNAGNFTFLFIGSLNVDKLKPLLAKYLGSLPAFHKNADIKQMPIDIPAGKIERDVFKGTEPKATVNLFYSGPYSYNATDNLKMDALKEVIQIRLIERLREDESGVYSPMARLNVTKYPNGRFVLNITFGCAPENVNKLIASANDEIAKLRSSGPLQVNLDKFKAEDLRTFEVEKQSNNFWLGYYATQLQNNDDIKSIDGYPEIIKNITVEDVKQLANKYLSGDNYIKLILLPQNTPIK